MSEEDRTWFATKFQCIEDQIESQQKWIAGEIKRLDDRISRELERFYEQLEWKEAVSLFHYAVARDAEFRRIVAEKLKQAKGAGSGAD